MAASRKRGKLYPLFTLIADNQRRGDRILLGEDRMVGIAIAIFIALFGWGARYFGWDDPDGKVQRALATSFILGIIGGYTAKS